MIENDSQMEAYVHLIPYKLQLVDDSETITLTLKAIQTEPTAQTRKVWTGKADGTETVLLHSIYITKNGEIHCH